LGELWVVRKVVQLAEQLVDLKVVRRVERKVVH
jgi:hypothetical protein